MNDRDCWATPPDIFAKLHARYNFTIDVCATAYNAKLPNFITPEMDAFMTPWGNVGDVAWCNPPYSEVPAWLNRMEQQYKTRRVDTIMLLNYCCDCEYFWRYAGVFRVTMITPRIQFVPPPGIAPSSNSRGQILLSTEILSLGRHWNWKTNEWRSD